jgi:ATP-dependent Clp protease protease subunit
MNFNPHAEQPEDASASTAEPRNWFLEEKAFRSRTVLVFGATSAATHLYFSVPRERRFCPPNTRFLIHQPSGGAGGQATDIAIHAQEIIKARERIARTISRETGKPLEPVLREIERDCWLSAGEAVECGLVGRIITHKSELRKH